MLQLKNIKVYSFDLDYLDVEWEAVDGFDPLDYNFQVLRSEAQFGPFEPITGTFKDRYRFRDTTAKQKHPTRKWYYKVRVTRISDSAQATYPDSAGVALEALPPLDALEMARQYRLRLEEKIGRDVIYFPVRTTGYRCRKCYDATTQQKLRSKCPTCFDTGFVGGFHAPLRFKMAIIDAVDRRQNSDMAKLQPKVGQGSLANFPQVKEGDVVVEAENIRWRVAGPINRQERLRYTFRQGFALTPIPKDDVAYSLPINLDASNMQPSPLREFTNPQSLDYFEFDGIEELDLEGVKTSWPT